MSEMAYRALECSPDSSRDADDNTREPTRDDVRQKEGKMGRDEVGKKERCGSKSTAVGWSLNLLVNMRDLLT
jgi:hypothetical protein